MKGLKLNVKMKKRIRKAVAGVCLVSSVMVAAIPADYSGVAQADSVSGNAANINEPLSYSADSGQDRNDEFESPDFLSSSGKTTYYSYEIIETADPTSSGRLEWKFEYFIPGEIGGIRNAGVICGYNSQVATGHLSLSSNIVASYEYASVTECNQYITDNVENKTFALDPSKTPEDASQSDVRKTIERYFPGEYEDWYNNTYLPAVQNYRTANELNDSYFPTISEVNCDNLSLSGATDMDSLHKGMFYCDNHTSSQGSSLRGFTLVKVTNHTSGRNWVTGNVNNTCVTENTPNDGEIYVFKRVDEEGGNIAQGTTLDANGYLCRYAQSIRAIGENAFKGASNVYSMTAGNNIAYIGDSAFENSYIKEVNFESVDYIGNYVFRSCRDLNTIHFGSTKQIGKEAFQNCPALVSIVIPNGIEEIGFGAFADCGNLADVDFSHAGDVTIGEYAFYNTPKLFTVTFPESSSVAIGKAAFAMDSASGTRPLMEDFVFPANIMQYKSHTDSSYQEMVKNENDVSYNSRLGNFILAGRNSLRNVTMPANFGTNNEERIPMDTFSECPALSSLTFLDDSCMATYDKNLFQYVANKDFYVFGPMSTIYPVNGMQEALPRRATWRASTSAAKYVPYKYLDINGMEHYEVGIDPYRFDLETDDATHTATIISCKFIDPSNQKDIDLDIPGKVADYKVTELGDDCFETAIKKHILSLTIPDDSIQEIGAGVFSGCDKLSKVVIGSSIQSIGADAFSNCPKLTEVIWRTPVSNTQIEIADSAFATGGDMLYFEGDMAIGYGPFDYAMEDDSHYINSIGTRICYRSSGTNHYYVIRDEAAGENLLIDYPHYYALEPEVRDRFEHKTIPGDGVSENEILTPTFQDLQLVAETRNLKLPEAVTSIDIKSFYLPQNENNWIYLKMADDVSGDLGLSREDLYNNDNLSIVSANDGDYHSGLFSGYFVDRMALSAYETNYPQQPKGNENQTKGNDWITSIEMPGVTSIPEYAFDSCENLQSIIISEACEEIAPTAFRNCNALRTVTAAGDYVFDNYILYKTLSDGTYQIMTCLPGRGLINQNITDRFVNTDNDPKLADTSELEVGAFDGCAGLVGVDLSDTSIIKVPQNTFNNCKMLSEVTLPETPDMIIEGDAFRGNGATLKVTIPAVLSIADSAFDPVNTVTNIYTKPDCRFITTTYQKKDANGNTTNSKTNIYVHFIDAEFTVSFLNDDNTPYEERTVKSGFSTYLPDVDPTPKKEEHSGWIFDSWKYYYTDWTEYDQPGNPLQSVTTDLYAVAQFVPDPEMPYYTITFRYDDYSVFETKQVAEGNNALLPSTTPQPKLLEHEGWIFSHWNYYDSTLGIENVTEDRNAIAVFVEPAVNPGEPEKGVYTITFRYDDYSIFEIKQVAEGNNGLLPSTTPQPKLSEHQGWNFSHWNYYDSTLGLENVTEDRNAIAVFTAASGNGDASGNNPGSGSSGNNNPNNGNNNNNSSTSNNSASNNAANIGGRYNVVVENGAGGGYYAPGGVVTITAYAAPSGKVFDRWTTSNADIGFSNAFGASTTFIMPSHDVKVTATYKIPSASSNRVSQNGTTNSTNNKNSNTTSGSGTTTRNPSGGGTDVTVTTGTIDNNNKNLASATVSGSTDNFVVKITDSAAASAAVEQALRAQYGDLSNIRFVGFDISLYDETGTRKIENTAGLAVNITIPIPDDLVPYAGNNMAAGVVNGVLDPMAVKFTTIDGVPCMQFTATHFSPYAIYVNTNNLVSGVTDTTPKTGDIHPKWFLAIGLACISGVLFTWKDKKKVPV